MINSHSRGDCSAGQKALWLLNSFSEYKNAYNITFSWRVKRPFDTGHLYAALNYLTQKHITLRSATQVDKNGEVKRFPTKNSTVQFDLFPADELDDNAIFESIEQQSQCALDLENGQNWRWAAYTRKEDLILLCSIHHIAVDMWSINLLFSELSALLNESHKSKKLINRSADQITPAESHYHEFIHKEQQVLKGPRGEKLLKFWQDRLMGALDPLNLPTDHQRPSKLNFKGGRASIKLSSELVNQITLLSQNYKVSLFSFYLSVYQLLLHRVSEKNTILVLTPTSGRSSTWMNDIGMFVNPIIMRSDFEEHQQFNDFLQRNHQQNLSALSHQHYPLPALVEALGLSRDNSRPPLANVAFSWNEPKLYLKGETNLIDVDGSGNEIWNINNQSWERIELRAQLDAYDLFLTVSQFEEDQTITLEYNSNLYESSTIERYLQYYQQLLVAIAENPLESIHTMNFIPEEEQQHLLYNNDRELFTPVCVHQRFEQQVRIKADASAILCGTKILTYHQLNDQANQLAHYLRSHGAKEGDLIGLSVERSEKMIVAMLAIIKAGCAYVPLDPKHPKERLSYIVEDSGLKRVITESTLQTPLDELNIERHFIDLETESIETFPKNNLNLHITTNDLVYMIYTSGSTGKPKGVLLEHRGVSCLTDYTNQNFSEAELAGVLAATSLNFDFHIVEILATLGLGGACVIAESPLYLPNLPFRNAVTTLCMVPSAVSSLLSIDGIPSSVTTVNIGGEPLQQKLVDALFSLPHVKRVINAYGPSEDTVQSTYFECQPKSSQSPLIGKALPFKQVYIVDRHHQLVPTGVPGEVLIGGPGLARGYNNLPDKTKSRFIKNPFSTEASNLLYKSGDIAKRLPDGNLCFIGRKDFQIKIRGFRIETREVEERLSTHPGVKDLLVTTCKDPNDHNMLLAYVVPKPNTSLDEQEIRVFMKSLLPEYMVPTRVIVLKEMPLSSIGKVDRKALPTPNFSTRSSARPPRRSKTQAIIASAWQEVLGVKHLSVHDNFFDLGGHSLLMVNIFSLLKEQFPSTLTLTDLFQYPTIHTLSQHLEQALNPKEQKRVKRDTPRSNATVPPSEPIAIIGMSCRFPGANDVEEYWNNLIEGVESIRDYSDAEILASGIDKEMLNDKNFIRRSGSIEHYDQFDANFFGYSPLEAKITDPQHRLFLEAAWHALEHAGVVPDSGEERVGVFGGSGQSYYYTEHLLSHPTLRNTLGEFALRLANENDFLCSRVAYKINSTGPAISLQGACSTSLMAIHMACRSLTSNDCTVALAGGVSLANYNKGYLYQDELIFSPDGHCRAFDARANGTVPGQGVGLVVLKRLSDAIKDRNSVLAVITGSSTNNDGHHKIGYTAPSVEGQARAIEQAQQQAGVKPEQVGFLESHGTATPLGDPIEFRALNRSFQSDDSVSKNSYCAIGSVKSNIGHADAAAGVAGLIKAALVVKNGMIPPSIHFEKPNPEIDLENSPFYINTELKPWITAGDPRRAGVSSFGLGGANTHLIVEEYQQDNQRQCRDWHLIPLSAKSPTALKAIVEQLDDYLCERPNSHIQDLSLTLQTGRKRFSHRHYFVCKDKADLRQQLQSYTDINSIRHVRKEESIASVPKLVFMFPAQGSQYQRMGESLYNNLPSFKHQVDTLISDFYSRHPSTAFNFQHNSLLGRCNNINETHISQPALFVLEYSLAMVLKQWGLNPDLLIGHSFGEYVAACVANVMEPADALFILAHRGRLMEAAPKGSMLSVKLSEEDIQKYLSGTIELAAYNSSERCTLSGATEDIDALQDLLTERGVDHRRLPISAASHSQFMDSILDEYREILESVNLQAPQTPIISSLLPESYDGEPCSTADYWIAHLRQTNRFSDAVHQIFSEADKDNPIQIIEIGPGMAAATLARQHKDRRAYHKILTTLPTVQSNENDIVSLLSTIGELWAQGRDIDWIDLHESFEGSDKHSESRISPIPLYPFEHQSYWVSRTSERAIGASDNRSNSDHRSDHSTDQNEEQQTVKPTETSETEISLKSIWARFLGTDDCALTDNFFDLGGDSLLAIRVTAQMRSHFKIEIDSNVLLKYPTIAQLSQYIDSLNRKSGSSDNHRAANNQDQLLVEIRKSKGGKNWFLIHPGGGHVFFYNDIATHLPENDGVYGIQAKGVDGKSTPIDNIEAMANLYLKEIQAVQPSGPYYIGGSSFGGMVAFEISQQLDRLGKDVSLTFLVDTPGPGHMMTRFSTNAELLHHLFSEMDVDLDHLASLETSIEEQIKYIVTCAHEQDCIDQLPPNFNSHYVKMFQSHLKAMFDYTPKSYSGRILFFRHTEEMKDYDSHPEMAWVPLASNGAQVLPIPGNHISMNFGNSAKVMAHHLNSACR